MSEFFLWLAEPYANDIVNGEFIILLTVVMGFVFFLGWAWD